MKFSFFNLKFLSFCLNLCHCYPINFQIIVCVFFIMINRIEKFEYKWCPLPLIYGRYNKIFSIQLLGVFNKLLFNGKERRILLTISIPEYVLRLLNVSRNKHSFHLNRPRIYIEELKFWLNLITFVFTKLNLFWVPH